MNWDLDLGDELLIGGEKRRIKAFGEKSGELKVIKTEPVPDQDSSSWQKIVAKQGVSCLSGLWVGDAA